MRLEPDSVHVSFGPQNLHRIPMKVLFSVFLLIVRYLIGSSCAIHDRRQTRQLGIVSTSGMYKMIGENLFTMLRNDFIHFLLLADIPYFVSMCVVYRKCSKGYSD